MKIILTVNAAWNALNFRRPVIEALLAQGARVTVLAPVDDSVSALRSVGCEVIDLQMDVQGLSPWQDARLVKSFQDHFARIQPDVVLGYTVKNNIFGAVAAGRLAIPFLPNVSGLGTAFLSGGGLQLIVETLYKWAFRRLPIVFFQNQDDCALFQARGLTTSAQARILPGSGIDLRAFQATPFAQNDTATFLMVSRLLRDKGVMEYVEAARRLRARRTDVRFQILGPVDAANRSALGADDVARWQSEGIIEHLGSAKDVRPYIAQADCVVLPSYREGAPRTLLEAAAMARPVIATDVPGCRHVVDHGRSGLLCAPRDASALTATMAQYLDLPQPQRAAMGVAGRRKMEQEYDEKLVVAAYLSAISDLTGGPSRPAAKALRA
ncbi:glycosyltransferase family 4 protein [uncultured Aliiroseovarius sp.]|uniref:glycosyltransferase family 4 protein n=1 Tax=uncultured Aliiroseovarius sp. TaxID=1658783 RepID=UPI00262DD9D1|nr:glycosyltransferase family 4 protein [uncultured Aliiroseovarius sp.]